MPFRQRRYLLAFAIPALLAGCSTDPNMSGQAGGSLMRDSVLNIGPTVSYPLDKLVYWGAWIGTAYLILDPFAPNWDIEEARLPQQHVHMHLAMKRYYSGGAGEARVIFHRRAKELMRAGGYGSYEVIEYSEGMDSSMIGAQRTADGVVRFTKKAD